MGNINTNGLRLNTVITTSWYEKADENGYTYTISGSCRK